MIDFNATRANLKQWIQSPAFESYLKRQYPLPKWRFILGGLLTISPAFPIGIGLLINGFRKRSSRKQERVLARREAQSWEPIVCAIVIVNSRALATPGSIAPAALVGAFGFSDDAYMEELFDLMIEVGGLYGSDPKTVPAEHHAFTTLINDDNYHSGRRRPLPNHYCKKVPFQLFDAILESNFFPSNQVDSPLAICAGSPLTSSTFAHLPPEIVVWNEEEEPYEPNIIKHQRPAQEPALVAPVSENLEPLEKHIERYFGEPSFVYHELVSTTIHLDLHMIPPSKERPWHTIVTTGMSDIPMNVPEGAEEFRLAELMLRLPPEWPLSQEDLKDEKNYWPLRQLKMLARFPHEVETWLCYGHTIPNGQPAEPYAEGVPFTGLLLGEPYWAEEDAAQCTLPDGHVVNFWSLFPTFESEMDFKLKNGADPLLEKLIEQGYGDYVESRREPVV